MRHVLDADTRVHLPQPRILHGKYGAHAATVVLPGQHGNVGTSSLDLSSEKDRGPRAQRPRAIDRRERRQRIPTRAR